MTSIDEGNDSIDMGYVATLPTVDVAIELHLAIERLAHVGDVLRVPLRDRAVHGGVRAVGAYAANCVVET